MTTYLELQQAVARSVQDPDNATFTADMVKDMLRDALAEVGRIAPQRFEEQIALDSATLTYQLRIGEFDARPVPEIEVLSVEIWDGSETPPFRSAVVQPASAQPVRDSQAGWTFWGGILEIPSSIILSIDPAKHYLRVKGYSPYPPVSADDDVISLSAETESAAIQYARLAALEMLNASRTLFSQWQTRSGNTDITKGQLLSDLSLAQETWRRKSRAIFVIREAPG